MPQNLVIISCSIFKLELEHLQREGRINVPVIYLDSMLHMKPRLLKEKLDAKIEEYRNFRIILLFGDCHARMLDYENSPNVVRTPGINCAEIILGTKEYREKRKDGAFILLPEWSERWKEAFIDDMGFKTSRAAKMFMNEMHDKIIYLDTGLKETNNPLFEEMSEFLGLPIEIHPCSLAELENVIVTLTDHSEKQIL